MSIEEHVPNWDSPTLLADPSWRDETIRRSRAHLKSLRAHRDWYTARGMRSDADHMLQLMIACRERIRRLKSYH